MPPTPTARMEQKFVSVVEHRATAASDDNGGGGGGGRGGGRGGAIDAQRDTLLLPTVSMSKSGYAASHAAGLTPCRPTHEQLSRRGLPLVGMDESLSKLHEVKLKPNYARIRHEAAAMAGAGGLLASSSDAFAEVRRDVRRDDDRPPSSARGREKTKAARGGVGARWWRGVAGVG